MEPSAYFLPMLLFGGFLFFFAVLDKLTRIERLLSKLVPRPELSEAVKLLADDPRRKIEAIKCLRAETGCSLAEAKQAVEAYLRRPQA